MTDNYHYPQRGDWVRATIEGRVDEVIYREGELIDLDIDPANDEPICLSNPEVFHFEKIEPEYELGAYYLDALGVVYKRWYSQADDEFGWSQDGFYVDDDIPVRPLRKLVPEDER